MGIGFLFGLARGFLIAGCRCRILALCSLTLTDRGKHFMRTNGPFTLAMTAVGTHGLPCGILPRLLLARVCTEAVRTGRRDLMLGTSFRD